MCIYISTSKGDETQGLKGFDIKMNILCHFCSVWEDDILTFGNGNLIFNLLIGYVYLIPSMQTKGSVDVFYIWMAIMCVIAIM